MVIMLASTPTKAVWSALNCIRLATDFLCRWNHNGLFWNSLSFFMPHTPGHAKFLTAKVGEVALLRIRRDSPGAEDETVDVERFSWHRVRMAIFNPNTRFYSLALFFLLVP